MKKFILSLLLFLLPFFSSWAQVYNFLTTSYAQREYNYSTRTWKPWTDWYECSVKGVLNLNTCVVIIYSKTTQVYSIVEYLGSYKDAGGGETLEMKVIDQDNDKGSIRLRREKNGNVQLYVDFANVMWVYNVVILN